MSCSFFSVHNEKPEPRHSAIPVFLMLIGAAFLTHMSKPLFNLPGSQAYTYHLVDSLAVHAE